MTNNQMEREAFEHMLGRFVCFDFSRNIADGEYSDFDIQQAWNDWQARATTQPVVDEPTEADIERVAIALFIKSNESAYNAPYAPKWSWLTSHIQNRWREKAKAAIEAYRKG